MSIAELRSTSKVAKNEPGSPAAWLQNYLMMFGYGLAAMVLSSSVASSSGVIASGIGAVIGVLHFRWYANQRLRNFVPALMGLGLLSLGLAGPAWLGQWWLVPYVLGISATLLIAQVLTLALVAMGVVLIGRSLSQSSRALSIIDGLLIVVAICLRFSSHRNFHWGNPRFLSDWAGIQGFELPLVFALLGLAALLMGLVAGMRHTNKTHTSTSIIAILILLALVLWIGGKYLRNPNFAALPESSSNAGSIASSDGGNESSDEGENADEASAANSDSGASDQNESSGDTPLPPGNKPNNGDSAGSSQTSNAASSSKEQVASSSGTLPTSAKKRESPQPIAVVLLEGDVQPYEKTWYFRQSAVSLFNGRRLVTAPDDLYDTDIPSGFSDEEVFIGGIPLPENIHQIVPLDVHLIADQPRPFSLPSMISFAPLINPNTQYFRQSYRASSCVLTDEVVEDEVYDLYSILSYYDPGDSDWDAEVQKHYIQSPNDPRYKELASKIIAEKLTSDLRDELEDSTLLKALAIKRWLEQNTTYSEDPKFDDPAVNPAEQFLFGERHGYCVHITHASVYLMRSIGIPSRIGVGYSVPTERSGKSSAILIQSTDAHAWAEIYLDGAGWVIIDASPEKIDESTILPPEPDKTLAKFLADKARNKDEHQAQIQESKRNARGFPLRLKHLPWSLLGAILLLYGVKAWILLSPRFVTDQALIRVTQRAAILQLAEIGIQREFGETRTEFAGRIATFYPEFANLTEYHVRQTYGHARPLTRAACLQIQARIRYRARQATNILRRMIGRLDPRFWVLVR